MTTGQRIAELRKQNNLSQEALGDLLGVTRQSISKWESDAALPEVEKLVAMSRLFHISVGALLGVEEERDDDAPDNNSELTEAQLKMVEEIVARYIAAQPKPEPARRSLSIPTLILVMVVAVTVVFHIFNQLDRLQSQYHNINSSINNIQNNVNNQINGIANRVEEILEAQNRLVADYNIDLELLDPAAGMATFRLRVKPKTWSEGMAVTFMAEEMKYSYNASGTGPTGQPITAEAAYQGDQWYETTMICPLGAMTYRFSAVLETDGVRETQSLDEFWVPSTEPRLDVVDLGGLHFTNVTPGKPFTTENLYIEVRAETPEKQYPYAGEMPHLEEYKVGLFVNDEVVAWAKESSPPGDLDRPIPEPSAPLAGYAVEQKTFLIPTAEITMDEDDILWVAAVGTDNYGRRIVGTDLPYCIGEDGRLTWASQTMENLIFMGEVRYNYIA